MFIMCDISGNKCYSTLLIIMCDSSEINVIQAYHYVKKYLPSDWLAHACYYQYSIFLRVKIWRGKTRAAL